MYARSPQGGKCTEVEIPAPKEYQVYTVTRAGNRMEMRNSVCACGPTYSHVGGNCEEMTRTATSFICLCVQIVWPSDLLAAHENTTELARTAMFFGRK